MFGHKDAQGMLHSASVVITTVAGFAAFRRREGKRGDFDCLSELGRYLEALMTQKESAEIAQTCPILSSLQKGHSI